MSNSDKDPSIFGVIFYAVIMALIGALSGFVVLASISPESYGSIAEYESDLGENPEPTLLNPYYFEGFTSVKNSWGIKRQILLTANETTLELTDAEINAWLTEKFGYLKIPFSGEGKSKIAIVPGLPNVFIGKTECIHFHIPLEVLIMDRKIDHFLLIGKGYFSDGDPTKFNLSSLSLNAAAIPLVEKIGAYLVDTLLESIYQDDEFITVKEAWGKVSSLEVIEDGIRLKID